MTPTSTTTEWDAYWSGVSNENRPAATRLLELSPRVAGFFAAHLRAEEVEVYDDDGQPAGTRPETVLDWSAAADGLEERDSPTPKSGWRGSSSA